MAGSPSGHVLNGWIGEKPGPKPKSNFWPKIPDALPQNKEPNYRASRVYQTVIVLNGKRHAVLRCLTLTAGAGAVSGWAMHRPQRAG
jgi:hypothetical protein